MFKLCDWGVSSDEVFIYSNVLRLLIFHVQFEKENNLTNYFVKYGLMNIFLKLLKINSVKIMCNVI